MFIFVHTITLKVSSRFVHVSPIFVHMSPIPRQYAGYCYLVEILKSQHAVEFIVCDLSMGIFKNFRYVSLWCVVGQYTAATVW